MSKVWTLLLLILGMVLVLGAHRFSLALLPAAWLPFAPSLEYGLEHLGVVLVVAMLVRGTLEAASQREFLKIVSEQVKRQINASIKEDVQKSIQPVENAIKELTKGLTYRISNLFDESLREQLEISVLNPKFVRPEYTFDLTLKPLSGAQDSDLLEAVVDLKYRVQNVSANDAEYPVECWIDDVIRSANINEPEICRFTRIAYGDKRPMDSLNIPELESKGKIARENGVIRLQITTPPIKPTSYLFVDVQAVQVMRKQDHFVWNLVGLTQRLDVIVNLRGGLTLDNFDVFPRELHHVGHEAFRKTYKRTGNTTLQMALEQVLLPYQGIEIRWSPHPSTSMQSA